MLGSNGACQVGLDGFVISLTLHNQGCTQVNPTKLSTPKCRVCGIHLATWHPRPLARQGFRVKNHPALNPRDMPPTPRNLLLPITCRKILTWKFGTCPLLVRIVKESEWLHQDLGTLVLRVREVLGRHLVSSLILPDSYKAFVQRPYLTIKEWNARSLRLLRLTFPQTLMGLWFMSLESPW